MSSKNKIDDSYLSDQVILIFLKKKKNILKKINERITISRNCGCVEYNKNRHLLNLSDSINFYNSFTLENINNRREEIFYNLRDINFSLKISTIKYIEDKLGYEYINEMHKLNLKINNYIENKLISKIIYIEKNQKLLIKNQGILLESMNQINGNNYDIQVNSYLKNLNLSNKSISLILGFYNSIVKKMNAYNLAASVLSSGEISVNDSMVHTTTNVAKAGVNLIEMAGNNIPFGQAISSLATAGGIYYINKKQLEDNQNYYEMLNSVMHTEGISKLSSMKIIKQIDIENIKNNINTYTDYIVEKWRYTQIKLIKKKKLPIYNNSIDNIENFVINITKYHNILCNIILKKFIEIINENSLIDNCINCIKCIEYKNIFNSNIDNNTEQNIISFILIRSYFNKWKD